MAQRISVSDVRQRMDRGEEFLLVCGYDDEQKWKDSGVTGSVSFGQFQAQLADLPKNKEIIFYCG
jgi:rhodanese-related sulfurtransferase